MRVSGIKAIKTIYIIDGYNGYDLMTTPGRKRMKAHQKRLFAEENYFSYCWLWTRQDNSRISWKTFWNNYPEAWQSFCVTNIYIREWSRNHETEMRWSILMRPTAKPIWLPNRKRTEPQKSSRTKPNAVIASDTRTDDNRLLTMPRCQKNPLINRCKKSLTKTMNWIGEKSLGILPYLSSSHRYHCST